MTLKLKKFCSSNAVGMRSVVLLKNGALDIVECESDAVFALAKVRDAGVVAVFPKRSQAEEFVKNVNSRGGERIPLNGIGLPKW